MPTKIMKYEIIKPIDTTWETLGKVLNDLKYETRQVLNKTIQLSWEWDNFSSEYKSNYDVYPKVSDVTKYKKLQGYCYNRFKDVFNKFNTQNLSMTIKRAIDKWKADKKDVFKGDKSIASYRSDKPIELVSKSVKLIYEEGNYYAILSLISQKYKKEIGEEYKISDTQFKVLINKGNKGSEIILQRCIDGIYKISCSHLVKKGRKWLLFLSYTFTTNPKKVDLDKRMGIDLGIVNAVYWAIYDSKVRGKIPGYEIEAFKKQVENRKNQLLVSSKWSGEGRVGHGIKTKIKPIEFARDKITNFRNHINHKYSKHIVECAVMHNVGIIVMEDLKGITADDNNLKNWSYFDLQSKIEYKAKEKGIKVEKINPKYTSQRCSKCGFIDKENRETQSKFLCKCCGYETIADYNASVNIATPNIEEIIKNTNDSTLKI